MKKLALIDGVKPKVTLALQIENKIKGISIVNYKVSWDFKGSMVPTDPKGPQIKQVK
jgi:hypothetical protein